MKQSPARFQDMPLIVPPTLYDKVAADSRFADAVAKGRIVANRPINA